MIAKKRLSMILLAPPGAPALPRLAPAEEAGERTTLLRRKPKEDEGSIGRRQQQSAADTATAVAVAAKNSLSTAVAAAAATKTKGSAAAVAAAQHKF